MLSPDCQVIKRTRTNAAAQFSGGIVNSLVLLSSGVTMASEEKPDFVEVDHAVSVRPKYPICDTNLSGLLIAR